MQKKQQNDWILGGMYKGGLWCMKKYPVKSKNPMKILA